MKKLLLFLLNAILGIAALLLLNKFGTGFFAMPLNAFTVGAAALLGLPGVLLILVLLAIF